MNVLDKEAEIIVQQMHSVPILQEALVAIVLVDILEMVLLVLVPFFSFSFSFSFLSFLVI